jgi:hypothetical protein
MTPAHAPLRAKEPSRYMLQCSWVTRANSCCVSIHSAMKTIKPHKLKSPVDCPSHGEAVPDNFSKPV